jgi:sulfofructose kinase
MDVVCVGRATPDTVLLVPHLPEPDGRVPVLERVVAGGGPAATAASTWTTRQELEGSLA